MASTLRLLYRTVIQHEKGREQPPDLRPSLPTELWLLIISYIDGISELSTLSRTSKRLQALIERRLYGSLAITTARDRQPASRIKLDTNRQKLLLRALLSPRVVNLVTTFQITLPACDRPKGIWPKTLSLGNRCSCNSLDDHLGNALGALPNLQALQIRCSFCHDTADTRHLHLAKLAAKNLQELRLVCWCSRRGQKSQRILSSPCLDSVTRLQWVIAGGSIQSTIPISPQHTRDIIPLVNKLSYDCNAIFDEIVSHRRITHLGCNTMSADLHQAITTNNGHLVHIRMGSGCLTLAGFLKVDSRPYRNLRHVGCFHFQLYEGYEILHCMGPFTALEQLESIEVSISSFGRRSTTFFAQTAIRDVWNKALLVSLHNQHHRLKRVFLNVLLSMSKLNGDRCDFFVWERRHAWEEHMIAPFTEWDMVIGLEPRVLI